MDTLGPMKCVLIREVSSFQGAKKTCSYEVGTWLSVLIREVSLIQGCPLRGVPLYIRIFFFTKQFCNEAGTGHVKYHKC